MPPKKKKSGKKKKGGKKSGKKSAKPASQTEQLSELSKEFYLIQIRDLEQRLEKYQKKCDELEVAKVDYETQLKTHIDDKKSVTSYLKKNLETRGDEIQDLNDRLTGLQQAKDAEKDTYEAQLQQVRTDFQEMKDQLTSENMILGGKLASLEEFKVQKEDLMAKMQALDDSLKQKDVDHQDQIYLLERKQVVDKDRLKKEMVMRVNQVAAEFRKVSNKQMAETTKRTIRENVSINAQLAKMSDKTMEMIGENDELRLRDKQQRQQIELLETNEKELAKKNHSNQKIIRMLTEKCKSQEAMLAEYEMREEQYQELEQENELFRTQVENSRTEAATLSRDNEALEEELARLRGDLAETRANKNKLEKVLRDAAGALKQALRPTTSEDADESPYDVVEKRDSMLENLLVLLNSAAALGVGPAPREFGANRATTPKPRLGNMSPMPGSGKGIRKGEMSSSLSAGSRGGAGGIPHYQLGDLGLIPRPAQHLPSHLDKMKELSATTRLGTLKKVLTRSVAVQTVSAPKAMFFADQMLTKLPPGSTAMIHELDNQHQKRTSKVF